MSACGSGDSSGLTGQSGNGGSAASGGNQQGGSGQGGSDQGGSDQGGSGGAGASGKGAGGSAGSGGAGGGDDGGASFGGGAGEASGGTGGGEGGSAGGGGDAGDAGAAGQGGSAGNGMGSVSCGGEVCGLPQGQFCCQPQNASAHCVTKSEQCTCTGILCSTIELRCDGTEDCPAQICCFEKGVASEANVACANTCDRSVTVDRAEVCKVGVSGSCTKGGNCTAQPFLGLPQGYGVCRP
ncbi:MAG: hypothetical protein KC766_11260 [Myxococcales bacterium]|nr:hypothetical protein [Myxococcales bacterium]